MSGAFQVYNQQKGIHRGRERSGGVPPLPASPAGGPTGQAMPIGRQARLPVGQVQTPGSGGGSSRSGTSSAGMAFRSRRGLGLGPRRRPCRFCQEKIVFIDFKAVNLLRNYMTERGRILSARTTGTCAKHQRQLTAAIKQARNLALLPFSVM